MSTYEDASLIYYPSGVKSGKAYSLKPTDGSGDLTFTRASSATRVNESGLIESVATGVPRIDFTGAGCGSLILEPQRSNQIIYSTDIPSNAAYLLGGTTNTSGQTSPTGGTDAYLITEDSTTAEHFIDFGRSSTTTNTNVTSSFFIKPNGRNKIRITNYFNLVNQFAWVELDLSTNSLIQSYSANVSYVSHTITDFPNGWKRVSLTTIKAISTYSYAIRLNFLDNLGNLSYLGDGVSGGYVYGIQQEHNAAYPTSLINTTSTAVTRVADKSSTTGLGSIIGQTEGTIYLEGIAANINADLVGINRSATNAIFITKSNLNAFRVYVYAGGVGLTFTDPNVNTSFYKLAITYKSGNSYLYVNGVKIGATNTSTFTFSAPLNLLELAGNYFVGVNEQKIQGLMIFPTAKSEAEVAALTTL